MTECNRQKLFFSSLNRQKVQADFDGGRLTSDAGTLWLREINRRTGLVDALAGCIADPRQPAKVTHDLTTMLSQRIFGIAAGPLSGILTMRSDGIMRIRGSDGNFVDDAFTAELPPTNLLALGDSDTWGAAQKKTPANPAL